MGKKYYDDDNEKNSGVGEIVGGVLLLIVLLIFAPWISYWLSYFGGWITSLVVGATLCDALNTLFDTTRFTPDMLPQMAGALGWIGSFFKSISSTTSNKRR